MRVHDSLECSARCSVWQCVFVVQYFVCSNLFMDVYQAFWQEFSNYSRDSVQMNTVWSGETELYETVSRKRRSQVYEELQTGEHRACESCA